jgi:hypothetical protein
MLSGSNTFLQIEKVLELADDCAPSGFKNANAVVEEFLELFKF